MNDCREENVKFIVINGYLHKFDTGGEPVRLSKIVELAGCKPGSTVQRRWDDNSVDEFCDEKGCSLSPDIIMEVEDGYEFQVLGDEPQPFVQICYQPSSSDREGFVGHDLANPMARGHVRRSDKYMVVDMEHDTLAFHCGEDFDFAYFREMFVRAREHAVKTAYEKASTITKYEPDGSILFENMGPIPGLDDHSDSVE